MKIQLLLKLAFKKLPYSAKVESAHKEFKKAVGAAICRFDSAKNSLIIVVSIFFT